MTKMTTCKACGKEVAKGARACPNCGKDQRSFFAKHKIISAILVLFLLGSIGSALGRGDEGNPSTANKNTSSGSAPTTKPTESSKPTEQTKPPVVTQAYTVDLPAGHYTAGVDFPSGTYNLKAKSGQGNVSSSNMYSGGLNEIMGVKKNDFAITDFSNAKFEDGVIVSISSSLVITISSDAAKVSELKSRTNNLTKEVELNSGNYIAGKDFEAGVYNIIGVSGTGNVSSSNMFDGGLNEIIGVKNDGFSIKEFKNVNLEKDIELSVSGVTRKLVPSK